MYVYYMYVCYMCVSIFNYCLNSLTPLPPNSLPPYSLLLTPYLLHLPTSLTTAYGSSSVSVISYFRLPSLLCV